MLLIDGLLQRQCARGVALLGRRDGGPWTQYSSRVTAPATSGTGAAHGAHRGRERRGTDACADERPAVWPTRTPKRQFAMLGSGFVVTATLGWLSRFHPVREGRRMFAHRRGSLRSSGRAWLWCCRCAGDPASATVRHPQLLERRPRGLPPMKGLLDQKDGGESGLLPTLQRARLVIVLSSCPRCPGRR